MPTGTVTFLFTDIEGSTARWETFPTAMQAVIVRHDAIMRQMVEAQRGHVFKTVGDAVHAAFASAVDAVHAAVAAQMAMHAEDWSAFDRGLQPLRVRMGVHTGVAERSGRDYFGPPLNRTARLTNAGHGGQILLSLSTQQLVRDALPAGVTLRDLGEFVLPDLRFPERIFQVGAAGMPDIVLPLRHVADVTPQNRIWVLDAAEAGPRAVPPRWGRSPPDVEAMRAALHDVGRSFILDREQVRGLLAYRPADLDEYRFQRIAEWSQPSFQLDMRFVDLTLLMDLGEDQPEVRWQAFVPDARDDAPRRFDDLRDVLTAVDVPAVVVLGPPGSGKSTLLRRLEIDMAVDGLLGSTDVITYYVSLSQYGVAQGRKAPQPLDWLVERWTARYPDLPTLATLIAQGRLVLLLDALNEMAHKGPEDYRNKVMAWRHFLHDLVLRHPGNRVVFACRSLDYSAPLSTPLLRVPQVQIETMSDAQVRRFLDVHAPAYATEIWDAISQDGQRGLIRTPYFLTLLVHYVEHEGRVVLDAATLFTGLVRWALRREIERGNPLFVPGALISEHDYQRVVQARHWPDPVMLPDRGALLPRLSALAYAMQRGRSGDSSSQVRVGYDDARALLDHPRAEAIIQAGVDLGVLDRDPEPDQVFFFHQWLQEYFAAREMAAAPDPSLVAELWRADETRPSLAETLAGLATADPLPPLPASGWEETTAMAAAMCHAPDDFVTGVAATNLPLAARCAALPAARVSEPVRDRLRWDLVARTEDPSADLRARIAAGLALGNLGDPRLERRVGPFGEYLLAPMIAIPAGRYIIGSDEGIYSEEAPEHTVDLAMFHIGKFPVTNAEWACFMAAGGYEDERWWDTEAARAWRRGEGTAEGSRQNVRLRLAEFREHPERVHVMFQQGTLTPEQYALWNQRLQMTKEEIEAQLVGLFPGGRFTAPLYWANSDYNSPGQPVVGICWFEARAYCAWLSAQTGYPFRLPSEAEWEAAARGREGRRYPWGDEFDAERCNTVETHIRHATPIGVFPKGATPEGCMDMAGNTFEWTSSLFGSMIGSTRFSYPYRADDGRENERASIDVMRLLRGGGWMYNGNDARCASRLYVHPFNRQQPDGLRLACCVALA